MRKSVCAMAKPTKAEQALRWGMPMYDWHAKHPDKGIRFTQAMESVSQSKLAALQQKTDG